MGNTKVDLVEDLLARGVPENHQVVVNAKRGEYHDYENTIFAAPKMVLVQHLLMLGLLDLAEKARQGAYDDESPSMEQEAQMMKMISENPELAELLSSFLASADSMMDVETCMEVLRGKGDTRGGTNDA